MNFKRENKAKLKLKKTLEVGIPSLALFFTRDYAPGMAASSATITVLICFCHNQNDYDATDDDFAKLEHKARTPA